MPEVSKALKAKIAAWRRQHAALDAPAYRITLKSRTGKVSFNYGKGRGPDKSERFYDADDVERLLPYLSRQNARGYDIYITPIDSAHHYLVIDDLHGDALQRLRAAGYQPALVQESSADNQQAVIKTPRFGDGGPSEQSIANRLVTELNQEFGDPAFSGVIHPFRVSGFANKKPGRRDAFTRILDVGGLCQHAASRLAELRAEAQVQPVPPVTGDPAPVRIAGSTDGEPPAPVLKGDASKRYAQLVRQWRGLVREQGWDEDLSRVDWQVTLAMLREGWDPNEVRDSLLQASSRVWERHHNPEDYARRTADRAVLFLASAAAARGGCGPDEDTDDLVEFLRSPGNPGRGSEPR